MVLVIVSFYTLTLYNLYDRKVMCHYNMKKNLIAFDLYLLDFDLQEITYCGNDRPPTISYLD